MTVAASAHTDAVRYDARLLRAEHGEAWAEFERLLGRIERGRMGGLSDEEMLALPRLYRETLSSLSLARATSLDAALNAYLEGLARRGYFLLYGVRERRRTRIADFFRHDWPAAVRALAREACVMALLFFAAALIAVLVLQQDPSWYASFIPEGLVEGRTPEATAAELHDTLFAAGKRELELFATFLFTHNSKVAFTAYALGVLFAAPTALLVGYQGFPLGALFWLYDRHGMGLDLIAWIMIHGTTELLAIFLAGACGVRIGLAAIFPGGRRRLDAARDAGRSTGAAMIGVMLMLGVAGLLEGLGRQLITDTATRLLIGGVMLALWLAYFALVGRGRGRA